MSCVAFFIGCCGWKWLWAWCFFSASMFAIIVYGDRITENIGLVFEVELHSFENKCYL